MLPCKQDCELTELRQFNFTNINQIFSIIPFFSNNSRCYQKIISLLNNGTQVNFELKSDVIRSIFSQVDPVFFQIYKMIGNQETFNITSQYDPFWFLMSDFNYSMELQKKYDEFNSIASNLTVYKIFKNICYFYRNKQMTEYLN
jgi:hypothetical protein